MSSLVKVNNEYKIELPAVVREELGIDRGDNLVIDVRDGRAVLLPESFDAVERLSGLHKEIWEGVDAQEYVRQEREAWED